MLRPLGSSTGIGLKKIDQQSELDNLAASINQQPMNVCEFVQYKSSDGYYRKYRVFVINGQILPAHCIASQHWNIHSSSRYQIMQDNELLQQEQLFFKQKESVLSPEHIGIIKRKEFTIQRLPDSLYSALSINSDQAPDGPASISPSIKMQSKRLLTVAMV